jgi:ribosomal protein S4E
MVKGGYIQLTTHDGRNFLFKPREKLSSLKPGDTLVYNFKNGKIVSTFRFEEGVLGLIYWGSKRGIIGRIKEVRKVHPLKPRIAALAVNGDVIETIYKYVFPIGGEEPVISLGGVEDE